MKSRLLTGVLGGFFFLALCLAGDGIWVATVQVLAFTCAYEWQSTYRKHVQLPTWAIALNTLILLVGACYPTVLSFATRAHRTPQLLDAAIAAAPIALCMVLLARAAAGGPALGGLRNRWGAVGALYIGLPFTSLILLHRLGFIGQGAGYLLTVVFSIWAADTGAFFAGRALGRTPLARRLSPGKTVEGALGGLAAAILVGAAAGAGLIHRPGTGLILGVMAGLLGPAGDLWESALKRELGVKDFGTLLPGHGGALDRLDSLMATAPFALLVLLLHR